MTQRILRLSTIGRRGLARAARLLPAWLALGLVAGCFDEPKIEDRWTRVDVTGSSLTPNQILPPSTSQTITVGADITYRRIVTGFAVAELRASSSVTDLSVTVSPTSPRVTMAQDIDRILAGSVTMGREARAVTGWDHLIQHIDFTFTGTTPAAGDTTARGLFLLVYMGSGNKIELQGGRDSIVVTPFLSEPAQILPVGMELSVAGSGAN
jgi:hypothetical protein